VAAIPVVTIGRPGDAKNYSTPAAADTIANPDGKTVLHFKCSGTAKTVTITGQRQCSQGSTHNEVITVGATTGDELCGDWDPNRFNDGAGNLVIASITPDTTGLTVAAFRNPA
jgi:hypothetical protein